MNTINEYTPNRLTAYQFGNEQVTRVSHDGLASTHSRPEVQPEARMDSVHLSDDAKLLAVADRVAREGTESRTDKIERLREEVNNGTYSVDSMSVAAGIVRREYALFVA